MSVPWKTRNAGQPGVVYGTSAGGLSGAADAVTTTYTKADIVSANTQGLFTTPTSQMTAALKGWMDPGRWCLSEGVREAAVYAPLAWLLAHTVPTMQCPHVLGLPTAL